MKHIVITGGSRGLGDALSRLLPMPADRVFLVSRGEPASLALRDGVSRQWIREDLADPMAAGRIATAIDSPLDVLIHNAGIWEAGAFSDRYQWEAVTDEEERRIMQVNLLAPLAITRACLPLLRRSACAKIIFIGSTNGLENCGCREIAYCASKWGLRGAAHALRENLRADAIGVTIVNPGTIGEAIHDTAGRPQGPAIPPIDLANLIRCVIDSSPRTEVKEISVPAMGDLEV